MAELKFDMQRLAANVAEKVLDETEYKGRTLRDWIDDIASGEYVQAKSGQVGACLFVGRERKFPTLHTL